MVLLPYGDDSAISSCNPKFLQKMDDNVLQYFIRVYEVSEQLKGLELKLSMRRIICHNWWLIEEHSIILIVYNIPTIHGDIGCQ